MRGDVISVLFELIAICGWSFGILEGVGDSDFQLPRYFNHLQEVFSPQSGIPTVKLPNSGAIEPKNKSFRYLIRRLLPLPSAQFALLEASLQA